MSDAEDVAVVLGDWRLRTMLEGLASGLRTIPELRAATHMHPETLSRGLLGLTARGLVRRQDSRKQKPKYVFSATEKGLRILDIALRISASDTAKSAGETGGPGPAEVRPAAADFPADFDGAMASPDARRTPPMLAHVPRTLQAKVRHLAPVLGLTEDEVLERALDFFLESLQRSHSRGSEGATSGRRATDVSEGDPV